MKNFAVEVLLVEPGERPRKELIYNSLDDIKIIVNECTAFLHALVALEVIEYFLPLDLSATLVQNDDFHKVGV